MVPVSCPECGKSSSGGTPACPHCGQSLEFAPETPPAAQSKTEPLPEGPKKRRGILKKSIIGFLIIVALGGLLEAWKSSEEKSEDQQPHEQQTAESEQRGPAEPEPEPETGSTAIQAARLFQLFSDNAAAAEREYMGKRVAIEGVIRKVKSSPLGRPEIVFVVSDEEHSDEEHMVRCRFPAPYADDIAAMREGQKLVLVGTVEAFVPGSMLSLGDCQIAQ